MISYEDFKEKYRVTDAQLKAADISWSSLCAIYNDYENKKSDYESKLDRFMSDYLSPSLIRNNSLRIHSIGSRIKDSEHLIEKIVRRKLENEKKYKDCDETNYDRFLTDIAGIRILMVYKTDWVNIHKYIISTFENNEDNYIKNQIEDYDEDITHTYIAEPPKVHIRNGDRKDIYERVLSPDRVIDNKIYRSAHYIIKYDGMYIEIQVRTLFEEGWGEVDHSILYPTNKGNTVFKEYTELLNRLSGLADEMSSFFVTLKDIHAGENQEISKEIEDEECGLFKDNDSNDLNDCITAKTYKDSISDIIKR